MSDPVKFFATFDGDGHPTGFYPSNVWPEAPAGAIEITEANWQEFLEHQGLRIWNGTSVVSIPNRRSA